MAESELFRGDVLARIVAAFRDQTELAGILLVGSAALGQADYFSDLDVLCVWESVLDRPRRYLVLRTLGETERASPQLRRYDRLELDRLYIGGRETELLHVSLATLDHVVGRALEQHDLEGTQPDRYGFWSPLAWLQRGIVLFDANGRLTTLQGRLQQLPDALVREIIAQQFAALRFPVLYHLHKAAMRADGVFMHTVLEDVTGHLLRALFAFNGRFYPGTRWLAQELESLPLCPPHLYDRLIAVLTTAPAFARDVPSAMQQLVRDVAMLITPWYPDTVPAWALRTQAGAA